MAKGLANMKFHYVNVFDKRGKTIFSKRCISVQEANELFKKCKEEYLQPDFIVLKEHY
jgi:hypothetical protein